MNVTHMCPIPGAHRHYADGSITFRSLDDFKLSYIKIKTMDGKIVNEAIREIDTAVSIENSQANQALLAVVRPQCHYVGAAAMQALDEQETESGDSNSIRIPMDVEEGKTSPSLTDKDVVLARLDARAGSAQQEPHDARIST